MTSDLTILIAAAGSIGLLHTLLGPDHYLPFVVMARARKWSLAKTIIITSLCGAGHVASSIVVGLVGITFGFALTELVELESARGSLAAWMLITFGLLYFIWGLRRALRMRPHSHRHVHLDGEAHSHEHIHARGHIHVHDGKEDGGLTPWLLFMIFVFGPCEPLIPMLIYPAAQGSFLGVFMVSAVFGLVTVLTMVVVVAVAFVGAGRFSLGKAERYAHPMAGATVCMSGVAIQFLGL